MRGWLLSLCVLLACHHGGPLPVFEGPGRLLLVLEGPEGATLHAIDRDGPRRVPGVAPREARWIDPMRILVMDELPPEEEFGLPRTRLHVVDLAGSTLALLGEPGRHHDAEPSPDGAWLAVGAETPGPGDSDLEIFRLSPPWQRIAVRHQSLEEPRWRSDGRALVASVLMADPETDDDTGGGMLGTSFTWPRLHTLRRDLGDPVFVWDGPEPGTLAAGGTLPLWWNEAGVFARQRVGLVRCDPVTGGCTPIHRSEPSRRVVDGRRVGDHEAWLLTVRADDAFDRSPPDELLRVDLQDGSVLSRWHTPDGTEIADLDWIGPSPP